MFLTLTIESGRDAYGEHELADLEYPRGELIRPGALAVIAPMTRHWLAPLEPHKRPKPWLGVQWDVPESRAKEQAQQIVRQLGGVWVASRDRRYATWREEKSDA